QRAGPDAHGAHGHEPCTLSERSFFARAPLGCDVSRGRERDVRDESASVCFGGAGRQCIEAVLPLATDEVRRSACGCSGAVPERRVPKRPTRQYRGKSLYKTQPACIQVRETVEGHNHTKSLIVVALVMRTSNDRRTSPAGGRPRPREGASANHRRTSLPGRMQGS